jgi:hypothetical protein
VSTHFHDLSISTVDGRDAVLAAAGHHPYARLTTAAHGGVAMRHHDSKDQ